MVHSHHYVYLYDCNVTVFCIVSVCSSDLMCSDVCVQMTGVQSLNSLLSVPGDLDSQSQLVK